mmetsp:Transcript_3514/g.9175  ORF Transcript_3514/g.9175 Transcript_3514/m.9175 type:complete len:256 (-) Transcript_3514:1992-2759(-)
MASPGFGTASSRLDRPVLDATRAKFRRARQDRVRRSFEPQCGPLNALTIASTTPGRTTDWSLFLHSVTVHTAYMPRSRRVRDTLCSPDMASRIASTPLLSMTAARCSSLPDERMPHSAARPSSWTAQCSEQAAIPLAMALTPPESTMAPATRPKESLWHPLDRARHARSTRAGSDECESRTETTASMRRASEASSPMLCPPSRRKRFARALRERPWIRVLSEWDVRHVTILLTMRWRSTSSPPQREAVDDSVHIT